MGAGAGRELQWTTAQIAHLRRLVRDRGWRAAAAERAGALVAKSPPWHDTQSELAMLRAEVVRLAHRFGEVLVRQETASRSLHEVSTRLDGAQASAEAALIHLRGTTADLAAAVAQLRAELSSTEQRLQQQVEHVRDGATMLQHIVTDWLWSANAPLRRQPLISAIMPTAFPERIGFLRSAIESVVAQSYANWELIVLDDSPEPFLDPPPDWWPNDPRIRLTRGDGRSEGRARNRALELARGEIAAFLDDDCRWFPWWLHAVARAFTEDADLGIVHGVRVIEADPGGEAWTYAQALDGLTLHTANPADTNVMAYRLGLPDVAWPDISSCADYDTVIRLSAHGVKFLPVPAATYAVTSPSRAWAAERRAVNEQNFRTVQRRARRARPLRIVAHNGLYPLLSETYIGDELEALRRHDIDVVLSRDEAASVATPSRLDAPLFDSLNAAIDHHDPDFVLMHWAGVGLANRQTCAAARVPYGVRLHSFDGHHAPRDLIDAWCAGVWTFPHFARDHHLAFALDTLIIDPPALNTEPRDHRVVSVSAGLPKKDFPTLIEAMRSHREVPIDIAVATTNGFESLHSDLRALVRASDLHGQVMSDVDHAATQSMLRSAAASVYTLEPHHHIGQPRSVIEAALHGTPLVVPDDPAMRHLVGETAHFFRRGDAVSLAAAIGEALERPHPLDDRIALAERIGRRHADVAVHEAWANSVTNAVVNWQRHARTDRVGRALRWWWTS